MSNEARETYTAQVRQTAAGFLRDCADEATHRWQQQATALLDSLTPAARRELLEGVRGLPEYVAGLLAGGLEPNGADHLWRLAETAYRDELPYAALSRSLRVLKRILMQMLVDDLDPSELLAPVCDAVEDELDETRLRLNRYYTTLSEQRLRDSEQLTRFLLNNTRDAVFLVELETARIVMFNTAAVRLTGYQSSTLERTNFLELVPEERSEEVAEAFRRTAVSGSVQFELMPLVGAAGQRLPSSMQLFLVRSDHERRLLQVSVRDTGSESRALAAQQEEAAYLRAFVTDTADGVMVLDADNRIRSWNKGAEQIFGYTADEVLNREADLLVPPELLEAGELDKLQEVVRTEGFVRNYESIRLTKTGRRIDVNITRTALFDPETGEFIGASAVVRDTTERRRLERQMANKTRQLESLNRILEATSQVLDRDQTYRTIAAHMEGLLPADAILVALPEADEDQLRVRVLRGHGTLVTGSEQLVPRRDSVVGWPFDRLEGLRIRDLRHPGPGLFSDPLLTEPGYRSALLVPLLYNTEVVAVLVLLHQAIGIYDQDDLALLSHLAGHLAVILENARRFEEERKRAAQFELISRVGAAAIANIGDVGRLMRSVVEIIQTDFGYHDVAIYEVDEEANAFRLRAQAGHRRGRLGEGFEQPLQVGVFGEVIRRGASVVVDDVATDELYYNPQPDNTDVRSELCVPIRLGPRIFGILDVESQRPRRFDRLDRAAMEALASLLARCTEADESLRQMRMLQAMRQQIMEAVPSALILFDADLRLRFCNRRYCEFFGQQVELIMGAHVTEILPPSLLEESHFIELSEELQRDREPIDQREVRYFDFDGQERYADVRLRIVMEYETTIIVMLHDATNRLKRIYQLSMLQEIGEEMQQLLDIDRLLRAVLTCVTAGPGFGFNRASLFLVDRDRQQLVQRLEVGPETAEEAGRIWRDLDHKKTLREFLREYDRYGDDHPALRLRHEPVEIPITPEDNDLRAWRVPLMLRAADDFDHSSAARSLRDFSGAAEVLVVPLVSMENVIGLVVADNIFTGEQISRDDIRMLTTFANQAGMALSNAQAYVDLGRSLAELRETQGQLQRAEHLAGIGSVAAHVAHEIRNPLVSIGGFARRVQLKADQPEYVESRSSIIIREVERLEQILRNVADFTAPGKPELAPAQLNDVIREVEGVQQPVLEERQVKLHLGLAEDVPVVAVDRAKVQQVVLNLVKNAVEAMPGGGELWVRSRYDEANGEIVVEVTDSGQGIPADRIEEIFNPFFTSRSDGTGLGLAVSRKIITDHGGSLIAESPEGQGATFRIRLPVEQLRGGESDG